MKIRVLYKLGCGPSKELLDALKREGVKISKLNIDSNPHYAAKRNIKATPTTLLIENKKLIKEYVGFSEELVNKLKEVHV